MGQVTHVASELGEIRQREFRRMLVVSITAHCLLFFFLIFRPSPSSVTLPGVVSVELVAAPAAPAPARPARPAAPPKPVAKTVVLPKEPTAPKPKAVKVEKKAPPPEPTPEPEVVEQEYADVMDQLRAAAGENAQQPEEASAPLASERTVDDLHALQFVCWVALEHVDDLGHWSVEDVDQRNTFHRCAKRSFDPLLPNGFDQRAQEPDGKQDGDPAEERRYSRIGDKAKPQLEQSLAHGAFRTEPLLEQAPGPGHDTHGDNNREQGKQTSEKGGEDPRLPKPRENSSHHIPLSSSRLLSDSKRCWLLSPFHTRDTSFIYIDVSEQCFNFMNFIGDPFSSRLQLGYFQGRVARR